MKDQWQPYMQQLAQHPLFESIDAAQLTFLLNCLQAKLRFAQKGDILLLQGQEVNSVGVILKGQVHIQLEEVTGRRSLLAALSDGDLFGEAFACAGVASSPVTAMAAADCEVMQIDFARLTTTCPASCNFHSQLIRNMLGVIARKNIALNQKMQFITLRTTREKLSSYLLHQYSRARKAEFTIALNRSELADYLCVDRSAMSRELGNMRDDGWISFDRNRFTVHPLMLENCMLEA